MEVIVVPTLAPMTIGIAWAKEMELEATAMTTMEVVVELLCNMAVTSNPINKPTNGFEVTSRTDLAASFPKVLNANPIRWMENRKESTAPTMINALMYRGKALRFFDI